MDQHLTVEVAVIGGGVIGSSIAYHLARRGLTVALVEKGEIANGASGASAGGVRQQGRDLRELPLAVASIARWSTLSDELDADLEYVRGGHVRLIEDQSNLDAIQPWVDDQVALGLDLRLVTGQALQDLIPGLAPQVLAGTYSPDDGHANPTLTTRAFALAAARLGAVIQTGVSVLTIVTDGDRVTGLRTTGGDIACQWLIVAAGAWSTGLLAPLGVDLPVTVLAPQMILTKPMPPKLRQVLGSAERRLSLKQIATGGYLIGGGWPGDVDLDAGISTPRPESISGSYADASAVLPILNEVEIDRVWVGIEAITPDEVPIIGPVPEFQNLTIATGFSGHGFALSPIIGQVISESLIDGTSSIDLQAFALNRFRDGTTIDRSRHAVG